MQNGQAQRIAMTWAAQSAKPPVSIMALHGLGKELWEGVDAQAYIDQLRREWDDYNNVFLGNLHSSQRA